MHSFVAGVTLLCISISAVQAVRSTTTSYTPQCFQWCSVTDQTTPAGCVSKPPIFDDSPIWIYNGGWDSIDGGAKVIEILLREVVGYTAVVGANGAWEHGKEPMTSMGGPDPPAGGKVCDKTVHTYEGGWPCFRNITGPDTWTGPDILTEHWPSGYEEIVDTMLYKQKSVRTAGPSGYFGENGLYVTGSSNPMYFENALEFWKSYLNDKNLAIMANRSVTEAINVAGKTGGDFTCKHSWCTNGRYTPPQCVNNALCKDIVFYKPNWATAQIEQIVTNLNLNFTVVWGGSAWLDNLVNAADNEVPMLWYDFKPTTTVAQLKTAMVGLPPYNATQYNDGTHPGRYDATGPISTQFPNQVLGKFTSKRLYDMAPDADELVQRASLTDSNINNLLANFPAPKLKQYCDDACREVAACKWLKDYPNVWKKWIPVPRCPKGEAYTASSHTCDACPVNTIAPSEGMVACEPCPSGKVSSNRIACTEPEKEMAVNAAELTIIGIGVGVAWATLTFPPVWILYSLQTPEALGVIVEVILEGAMDAVELSVGVLIISQVDDDVATLQLVQMIFVCVAMINIVSLDVYSTFFMWTGTKTAEGPDLRALSNIRHTHSYLTLFIIVLPIAAMEIALYLDTLSMLDFACVIVLSFDVGYRTLSAVKILILDRQKAHPCDERANGTADDLQKSIETQAPNDAAAVQMVQPNDITVEAPPHRACC